MGPLVGGIVIAFIAFNVHFLIRVVGDIWLQVLLWGRRGGVLWAVQGDLLTLLLRGRATLRPLVTVTVGTFHFFFGGLGVLLQGKKPALHRNTGHRARRPGNPSRAGWESHPGFLAGKGRCPATSTGLLPINPPEWAGAGRGLSRTQGLGSHPTPQQPQGPGLWIRLLGDGYRSHFKRARSCRSPGTSELLSLAKQMFIMSLQTLTRSFLPPWSFFNYTQQQKEGGRIHQWRESKRGKITIQAKTQD